MGFFSEAFAKLRYKAPKLYLVLVTAKFAIIDNNKEYIDKHYMLLNNDPSMLFLKDSLASMKDGQQASEKTPAMDSHFTVPCSGMVTYEISEQGENYGFFAELKVLLEKLLFAQMHGFAPSVKYTKGYLYFDEDMAKTVSNPFEYFFEPIESSGESKAYTTHSSSTHSNYIEALYGIKDYYTPKALDEALVEIIKKYIHIKSEITAPVEEIFANKGAGGKKILGIHYRGTDYKQDAKSHPTHISFDQLKSAIAAVAGDYDYIYVATDEKGICEKLKESFGDKVFYNEDCFRGNSDISVAFSKDERKNHHYLLGVEVIRDMYSLSKCDALIAGLSQVSYMARLFKSSRNEEYSYINIIDNGINTDGDFFRAN